MVVEKNILTKYNSLRTQFRKALIAKEKETRSGAGTGKKRRAWAHFDTCYFLRDYIEVAPQISSIAEPEEVEDEVTFVNSFNFGRLF